jgi:hypothetical protein
MLEQWFQDSLVKFDGRERTFRRETIKRGVKFALKKFEKQNSTYERGFDSGLRFLPMR